VRKGGSFSGEGNPLRDCTGSQPFYLRPHTREVYHLLEAKEWGQVGEIFFKKKRLPQRSRLKGGLCPTVSGKGLSKPWCHRTQASCFSGTLRKAPRFGRIRPEAAKRKKGGGIPQRTAVRGRACRNFHQRLSEAKTGTLQGKTLENKSLSD